MGNSTSLVHGDYYANNWMVADAELVADFGRSVPSMLDRAAVLLAAS